MGGWEAASSWRGDVRRPLKTERNVVMWMDLKSVTQSERSQKEKNKYHILMHICGFPHSSVGKSSACNAGDSGLIPGSGRSPGAGNGNPLQYSCLENPMDGGAWQATVHRATRVRHNLATKPPPPVHTYGIYKNGTVGPICRAGTEMQL